MTTKKFYQSSSHLSSEIDANALFRLCLDARQKDRMMQNSSAFRLFNGFYEGIPGLVVDKFDRTLLIKNFDRDENAFDWLLEACVTFFKAALPDLNTVIVKKRYAKNNQSRQGVVSEGKPAETMKENGVFYTLDLLLNQDDSFYLDTRFLRSWLKHNMAGKSVLNTFAYTGALGIAALAGGAKQVIQSDLSQRFLDVATNSASLNASSVDHQVLSGDYFKSMARLKNQGKLFDCVIVDPPLFSKTPAGEVSLLKNWVSLINKARPLVGHEGYLILINNALFLSGQALQSQIQDMCTSGYMKMDEIIDVPPDITGYPDTIVENPPTDPKPYNHPTKITITRVSRKDGQRAS